MRNVENITIPCAGGSMPTAVLWAARLPAPTVFVISTIFGVDHELQDIMRDYTRLGFTTVAPDMFWRRMPGPLDHRLEAEYAKAVERNDAFDVEQGVRDLARAIDTVRAMPAVTGPYGIIGFCFGGRYAYLAAARLGASVVASFHGSFLERNIDEAPAVRCPITLHYGDVDPHVPLEAIERLRVALSHNPDAEVHLYQGVGHGYTSPTKPSWNAEATAKSHARAQELLQRHLAVLV
jgi:carboxymethylenebutenolidase